MLSPTKATMSSGGPPAFVVPAATAAKRGFLSDGAPVGPAEHHVVDQFVRLEQRFRIGALRLQPVGDDGDASAEIADAREKVGGAGKRRGFAPRDPRAPALRRVGQLRLCALDLILQVADDCFVGVEDDRPRAGLVAARGRGDARGAPRDRSGASGPGTPRCRAPSAGCRARSSRPCGCGRRRGRLRGVHGRGGGPARRAGQNCRNGQRGDHILRHVSVSLDRAASQMSRRPSYHSR